MVNTKDGSAISYRYLDFSAKKEWSITLEGKVFCDAKATVVADGVSVCEIELVAGSDKATGRFEFESEHCDVKIVFNGEKDKELLELEKVYFE